MVSRRQFLAGAAGFSAAIAGSSAFTVLKTAGAKFRLGATDWNLRQEGNLQSIALAKKIGFDGVQVSIGVGTNSLPLSDPARQKAFLDESRRVGLPVASVCLEVLHRNPLKSDPIAPRFVADSVDIARALGVRVVLLPFFGKGALETRSEMDYVGDALKEIAPAAERAGVILGLEDTISAEDNVHIMERTKSPVVLTYYDVGNSTEAGFDIYKEIRWLGGARICEVHLKDNPRFLGEGTIDFPRVVAALVDSGFDDWAHLETECPTGSVEADMGRNLGFVRALMK